METALRRSTGVDGASVPSLSIAIHFDIHAGSRKKRIEACLFADSLLIRDWLHVKSCFRIFLLPIQNFVTFVRFYNVPDGTSLFCPGPGIQHE